MRQAIISPVINHKFAFRESISTVINRICTYAIIRAKIHHIKLLVMQGLKHANKFASFALHIRTPGFVLSRLRLKINSSFNVSISAESLLIKMATVILHFTVREL